MSQLQDMELSEKDAFHKIKQMRPNIIRRLRTLNCRVDEIDFANVSTISQILGISTHNVHSEVYQHLRENWEQYLDMGCKKNNIGKITLSYRAFLSILQHFSYRSDIKKIFEDSMSLEKPVLASTHIELDEDEEDDEEDDDTSYLDKLETIKSILSEKIQKLESEFARVKITIDIISGYEQARLEAQNIISKFNGENNAS